VSQDIAAVLRGDIRLGARQRRERSEDALKIAHRAVELGFTSTVGLFTTTTGS